MNILLCFERQLFVKDSELVTHIRVKYSNAKISDNTTVIMFHYTGEKKRLIQGQKLCSLGIQR